ncbi:MAG: NrtA/SsuA/CpmA family ABC transporter substrate-binding protein [Treponema sp.]|jgi:NitT/TauT family transport system substrate-binding protein/sulfonate transport system substrate-binding protein|nr:NrtA/SsuA/CpmA family ABC transporter substrate-binding protein [Treponema sp.]
MKNLKKIILAAALAVLAAGAFGQSRRQQTPRVINISYVESPFNLQIMVMKERRMLETAFAARGVEVRWHDINSGADQTQAMAAGSLDIASVINSTSVILANAAGNPVNIAALVSRPRQSFALMVGPDGPRSVRELKGKTVAGPKGTVLHQMLIAALVREGMSPADVNLIQMGLPEARTALLAGRVDGALQAASLIIRNQEARMRVLITADGYMTPLLFTAVRPGFVREYPELVRLYLDIQAEAYDWIAANTREAVAIGSRMQQISADDGMKLFQWSGIARVMERSDLPAIQADVDFLYEQGMIERKVRPGDFILPNAYGSAPTRAEDTGRR